MTLVSTIDATVLHALAPRLSGARGTKQTAIIDAFGAMLPALLSEIGVTTAVRIQHFLSQVAHESDGFATLEEYASGAAYEGRTDLGNYQRGDGVRFKGRGPIQLTGRANYRKFTAWMRKRQPKCPDFEVQPVLVATWPWAGWAAAHFWAENGLNALADRDDLVAVTKRVNGGRNGLADRAAYLAKAKAVTAELISHEDAAPSVKRPMLRRGSNGAAVDLLQRGLAGAGHYLLAIDGEFGPGTEGAVKTLQRARGLDIDGVVGGKTWAAIEPFITEEMDNETVAA